MEQGCGSLGGILISEKRNRARACTHAVIVANRGTKTVAPGRRWFVSCNPAQAG